MPSDDLSVTVKIEASDERELIARFVEYCWDHSWVVQDTVDAIRSGAYIEILKDVA